MKKLFSVSIVIIFMVICSACQNNNHLEQPSSELSSVTTSSTVEVSTESTALANISDHFLKIYDGYKVIAKNDNINVEEISTSGKFTKFSLTAGEKNSDVTFYDNEKSFQINIIDINDGSYIKTILAETFQVLGSITREEAQSLSQELANSYQQDNFSKTIPCGDYLIVLSPKNSWGHANIFVRHNDELWNEIEKDNYPQIDRAMYEAPTLNIGEKCKISGTISEWYIDDNSSDIYEGTIILDGDDGKQYVCTYLYDRHPIVFTVGDRYTIYGSIGRYLNGDPLISISFPEKI